MTAVFLSLHVLAAIIAIGPICVAASMFPAVARRAFDGGTDTAAPRLAVLARICRVYAAVGIAVPVLGMITAGAMGVLAKTWVVASMALTFLAFVLLATAVLPRQQALLTGLARETGPMPTGRRTIARLGALTGLFNLLWATVTVLMIVRPGSTTGV